MVQGFFFSAFLTCWAKCKWCHLLLLECEAKLSGHGGFTEHVVWLTLKWLWGYFFSISILLEIFSRFYCRWGGVGRGREMHNATETKRQLPSCSWIIAILSQLWLKSKTLYRSLNEMLANIFLPHWKCNLSIEHFVLVNFICKSILHLNQKGHCWGAEHRASSVQFWGEIEPRRYGKRINGS